MAKLTYSKVITDTAGLIAPCFLTIWPQKQRVA
jgi:hypothetical protein